MTRIITVTMITVGLSFGIVDLAETTPIESQQPQSVNAPIVA